MGYLGSSANEDFAIISAIFGGLMVVLTIVGQIIATMNGKNALEKSNNRVIAITFTLMAPFFMWLHWAIAWLAQLHPMVEPTVILGETK